MVLEGALIIVMAILAGVIGGLAYIVLTSEESAMEDEINKEKMLDDEEYWW